MAEQEALLESYRSACKIRHARWRYRQWVAEVAAFGKERDDEAGEAVFGETDEEEEDIASPCPAATTTKPTRPRASLTARKSSAW
jgi:hypothetical protein